MPNYGSNRCFEAGSVFLRIHSLPKRTKVLQID